MIDDDVGDGHVLLGLGTTFELDELWDRATSLKLSVDVKWSHDVLDLRYLFHDVFRAVNLLHYLD